MKIPPYMDSYVGTVTTTGTTPSETRKRLTLGASLHSTQNWLVVMTPEGKTKQKIAALLKKYQAYYFMPVQNGMGAPGLDFHCVIKSLGFCVEAKAWGTTKNLTDRQVQTKRKVEAAGGKVFMVRDDETMGQLENWLVMVLLTGGNDRLCAS